MDRKIFLSTILFKMHALRKEFRAWRKPDEMKHDASTRRINMDQHDTLKFLISVKWQ